MFVSTKPSTIIEPIPFLSTIIYALPHSSSVNGCNDESYDESIVPSNAS